MLTRLLKDYLRPYRTAVALVVLFQLISTLASLYLPSLNAKIIDTGVVNGDVDYIWRTGGLMLLVSVGYLIVAIAAVYFSARASMGLGRDLRRDIFKTVSAYSSRELNQFGAPSLITRNTNDVQQVQMVTLMGLAFMVSAPITCVGGIIMALREDVGLSWLILVSVPLLLVIVGFLVWRLIPLFKEMQKRLDAINGILREQITGIRVVRAFVREPHETARFEKANQDLTDTSVGVGRVFVLMFPVIMLILNLATAAVLWFGGKALAPDGLQIGQLTAYISYLMQILVAVMMGTFMAMMIPRASVCADRIGEVLDTKTSITLPSQPVSPAQRAGVIEFKDATFAYPGADKPVLKNISFEARPGQTVAIIGATGSGKSTLLNLVPRLFDVVDGAVVLDGVDVRQMSTADITSRVAIVPQRPFLFSGTIASNLRFGDANASDDDLWRALTIAQGADFVRDKEGQLESAIAQGGTNVSGGQRQRLCIARALVSQPKVYLFDDSFSALDVSTDARLRAALKEHTRDATVIVVAQRVTTITQADLILVLDDGEIVDRGTHEYLLENSETYKDIVESQLSEDEVAA
ncbi:ABC transporter ATP-binding protein [Micrococcales bacterium 31B]|nr:ABC transporter ATP-binding protein [Micrococcales bacterium 31B]